MTETGNFRDGKFVHGKVQFEKGEIYEGAIEFGKKTGEGKLKFPDGTKYEGQFKHDKF